MPLNIANEEDAFQLAIVAQREGRLADAEDQYQHVLKMNPRRAGAYQNLGVLAFQVGKFDRSLEFLNKAMELGLKTPGLYCSMGDAYAAKREWESALTWYQKAMDADPEMPGAYNNAGAVLLKLGRVGEAVAAWEEVALLAQKAEAASGADSARAQAFRRFAAAAFNNLGEAYLERGLTDFAREKHQEALQLNPAFASAHSNLLRDSLYLAHEPADVLAAHQQWWPRHAANITPLQIQRDRNPDRPLRIGFISADFREHANAHFLLPLFENHDREQLSFACYVNVRRPDDYTLKFAAHAEAGWRNIVGYADESVAAMIDADKIDVLVDLSGHTADNRLRVFAYRPAAIQVSWLGYPLTTGSPFIDYRLADPVADEEGLTESHYTEKLWRLPHTAWCYRPPAEMAHVDVPVKPPVMRAAGRAFVFGGFAACPRISDHTVTLWAGAMNAVPGSKLLLKSATMGDKQTRRNLRERFAGIDTDRITFVPNQPTLAEHLAWYRKVDLALDTFPYEGLAQTCDALWLGVPVLTMAGKTAASRHGAALLQHLGHGIEKLISHSDSGFIKRAATLAKDLDTLTTIRNNLRRRMEKSPLRDEPAFAADFTAAMRAMWRHWCAQQPAAS